MNNDRERLKQILNLKEQWVLEEVLNYMNRLGYKLAFYYLSIVPSNENWDEFFKHLRQLAEGYYLKLIKHGFLELYIMEDRIGESEAVHVEELKTALSKVMAEADQIRKITKQAETNSE